MRYNSNCFSFIPSQYYVPICTFGQIKPSDFRHSSRNEAARGRHHYLSPRASSSSVTRVKAAARGPVTQSGMASSSSPASGGQVWHSQGSFCQTRRLTRMQTRRGGRSLGGEWVSLQRRAEKGDETELGKRKECSRTAGDLLT